MSSFGQLFKVTTFGESHCKGVGCIVEGVPPGFPLTEDDIQPQLTRRRPGQSDLTTPRDEKDRVSIFSGTEMGITLGTPISLFVPNQDHRPADYSETDTYPRPSHADWTYLQKYGVKASSGGGRSSARETIARVASGAIAEKYLAMAYGVEIVAYTSSIGGTRMQTTSHTETLKFLDSVTRAAVDSNEVRCPDTEVAAQMRQVIERSRDAHDSIGGTVTCVIRNVPMGLGEPCFDKLEACLAHAMLSIPATKGVEFGSGFDGTQMCGSVHNDAWVMHGDTMSTKTNYSGGIQGGISNGQPIFFKVAFKPAATIGLEQHTATYAGDPGVLKARGRHDPCVVPRAIPIVEGMAALVIMDAVLQQNARCVAAGAVPAAVRRAIDPRLTGTAGGPKSNVV